MKWRLSAVPSSFILPPSSLLRGARAGFESADAGLTEDAHLEVARHPHLTREANVLREPGLGREPVALGLEHLAGVAVQNLDAARRALRVTAAAVQNVYARVLDCEHELAPLLGRELLRLGRGLRSYLRHLVKGSPG